MLRKYNVFMSLDRREIVEDHGDWVLVVDHLKPDPNGPYWVGSDYAEPTWATREYMRPAMGKEVKHGRETP